MSRRRYVPRGVPGGYRIWDNKGRRWWWGDLYQLCPDDLVVNSTATPTTRRPRSSQAVPDPEAVDTHPVPSGLLDEPGALRWLRWTRTRSASPLGRGMAVGIRLLRQRPPFTPAARDLPARLSAAGKRQAGESPAGSGDPKHSECPVAQRRRTAADKHGLLRAVEACGKRRGPRSDARPSCFGTRRSPCHSRATRAGETAVSSGSTSSLVARPLRHLRSSSVFDRRVKGAPRGVIK